MREVGRRGECWDREGIEGYFYIAWHIVGTYFNVLISE